MSFIFRRLSRSSKKGRSVSLPLPITTTHNVINNNDDGDNAYEHRIDELGKLLSEQGRCLDELTSSNRRISNENAQLRDKLTTQQLTTQHSAPSSSSNRTPLKNILNNNKSDESKLVSKLKEENKLLHQQSELLAAELRDANASLSNRDETVSSLGKELSTCLETARKLLVEKRTRDIDLFQKTKQLELAETNLKRATDQQSDTTQRLESCLLERTQLNEEVSDLSTQLNTLASKIDKQANEIESKNNELEKAAEKRCEADLAVKTSQHEAKLATESANSMKNDLCRCMAEQNALELKLKSTRDELQENNISQLRLQTRNERLETDIKIIVEKHKDQLSQWTKGQQKCIDTLKEQHLEETRSQQKIIDDLRRSNTSLESDSAQCRRDLLSSQQRCSKLEKLLETREDEHRDNANNLLSRASDAEIQLDMCVKKEKNLKSTVSSLEEKLTVLQTDKQDEARHSSKVVEGLRREVTSLKDSNMELSTQVSQLQDEIATTKEVCDKQTQKMNKMTDHKVKQIEVECEALRVRNQKDNNTIKELEVSIEKQSELHQATVGQLVSDSKEKSIQLGNVIEDEREVSKCLMMKVQETNATIQALTQEKHHLTIACSKNINKLYEYERIIQAGELKLAHFGKQLSRSLNEQEARISNEVELKKQLNSMHLECERLKRQSGA